MGGHLHQLLIDGPLDQPPEGTALQAADHPAAADRLAWEADAAAFPACAAAFGRLEAAVRSHFGYEEGEIGPALGFHGIRV